MVPEHTVRRTSLDLMYQSVKKKKKVRGQTGANIVDRTLHTGNKMQFMMQLTLAPRTLHRSVHRKDLDHCDLYFHCGGL